MALVWVTGNSGAGKSTVCERLKSLGHQAVDADWEGYNRFFDRVTGEVVVDPPYPAPQGWLDRYGWQIDRARVEALAARSRDTTVFLCGGVENEDEVRDLFDLVVCIVIDEETLRERLLTRTTNSFGKNPEELASALDHNDAIETFYRSIGATIIDGTQPLDDVVSQVIRTSRGR
ncbi:AAA family ATPase [Lentzea sp. NPDC059081]|uniref:AAA family ATPase n=1 Tax=Lentzea sp. NPDC059081 TaxID=3346719 RepID=UPI003686AEF2